MTSEFRRAHPRRTHVGDVLRIERDCHGNECERVVLWVEGAPEHINRVVDGRYYRYRPDSTRNSLASPVRAIRSERSISNWRMA